MQFRLFHSCKEFPQGLQHLLKDAPLFLQYSYMEALEKSEIEGLSFRYVGLIQNSKYVALYAYQLVSMSHRNLHRIFYRQQYSSVISKFSAMMARYIFGVRPGDPHYLVVNGSVLISGPYYGWASRNNQQLLSQYLNDALNFVTTDLAKQCKIIATVVKDMQSDKSFKTPSGFNKVMMDPVMEMKLQPEWKNMDDYLADISAKYRLRYNNARKKLKGVEVRTIKRQELAKYLNEINHLYYNVQQRAPIRLIAPDIKYLKSMMELKDPSVIIKGFFLDEKLILFLCGISRNGHFEAHHIGMDYHLNKKHQLYLNMLYTFLEEGIKQGVEMISFGRTALEIKSTIGAEPVVYQAWIKLGNHILNKLVRPFIPDEPSDDWVQRNPFRE